MLVGQQDRHCSKSNESINGTEIKTVAKCHGTPCYKCDDSALSPSLIVHLVGWFSMFRPMKLKLTATKSIPVYKCAHKLNEHILTIDFSVQKGTHGTNGQYTVTEQNQF